ncbi:MAG: response regulator transcription factor [Chitinophagales bacterium]
MAIRVAIVEDKEELRQNLKMLLSYYDELAVVCSYSNAEDFLADYSNHAPDVVIMDINLPGLSGIKAVELVKAKDQHLQVLMCTIYEDEENIFAALCAGAAGYLMKNTTPENFYHAIKAVYTGGSSMSPSIARKVVSSFQQKPKQVSEAYQNLSVREKEILDLLAKGLRYKEVSAELFISIETVRTHIRNIYDKLQVNSRTEALNKIRG